MSAVSSEGDAEIERAMQDADRLRFVGIAVELGHAHAAEPQFGNRKAAAAELTRAHETIRPAKG
jgi:hypothetical protein